MQLHRFKDKLHKFLVQDTAGAYMVISAILLSLLIGICGLVISGAFGTLNKVRNQSSTDLAVVSASAACIGALKDGVASIEAQGVGLNTGQALFEQNIAVAKGGSNLKSTNLSNPKDCNYRLTYVSSTDVFLNPFSEGPDTFEPSALSESNTNIIAGSESMQSLEVVFAFDDSYSMRLKLQQSGQVAADVLTDAVQASYDTLFDGLSPDEAPRFAASQLGYSKNISFDLTSKDTNTKGGFTNDKEVLKSNFTDKYKGGDDSTNIFAGLSLGIEKLVEGEPKIKELVHNEVLVLMSDGVPNITRGEDRIVTEPEFKSYNQRTCNGPTRRTPPSTKRVPVYKDDILVGYRTQKSGGKEVCDAGFKYKKIQVKNKNAGKTRVEQTFKDINNSSELLAERDRIIDACQQFVKGASGQDDRLIFSVFFETDNENIEVGKEIMQGCASSTDTFYYARNREELVAAYQEIASKLLSLAPSYAPITLVQ